ncbi:MAG: ACT domain-containing protein [Clostridiales bacterium]|nr:ACT domain-containing protein [Clostridiales bacterium]
MSVKQINVFLENESGRLAEVTAALAKNKIDIRALYVADTTEYGILRMLVNQPDEAQVVLQNLGFTVSQTSVIAVAIPDTPGTLDKVLGVLSANNISLEYLYAFVGRASSDAVVVIRVDDKNKALEYLEKSGVKVLDDKEVYGI